MENKKTKLTISGNAKKSIKNIEIAKTHNKNSVVIEKTSKTSKKSSKHYFTVGFLKVIQFQQNLSAPNQQYHF